MYFYGSFLTQLGETVTVHIVTENSRAQQVEIGDEKSGVFFTTNPVEIESSVNDTFDVLLRSQARIRLLTRDFIPNLFCTTCMDAVVNIFRGDKCIFAGFIEPQTYSQGYNEVYDELEISCIDVLSALQYSKYRNVGGLGVIYNVVKANAGQRSFDDIIKDIFEKTCKGLRITGTQEISIYYDGSKSLTETSARYDIFKQLAISELLFLENEEDNVWQLDVVLDEILKYLNLHIVQEGFSFYIFSWESIKNGGSVLWRNLLTDAIRPIGGGCIEIEVDKAVSTDTSISIGEVFNQIRLSCTVESVDDVIENPLSDSDLSSPFSNRQLYMTEISADGEGKTASTSFYKMIHDRLGEITYDRAITTDWYMQVKNNPRWIFPERGTGPDVIGKYCSENKRQHTLPNILGRQPGAAIIALGSIETKHGDKSDNSPVSKVDMTDYMVVSVNGNADDTADGAYPDEASLLSNAPCAIYNGSITGAVFSPADNNTKNYLVISGKIILNPLMELSADYSTLKSTTDSMAFGELIEGKCVPSRDNGDGRYYTQKYWKAETPGAEPVYDPSTKHGLVPYTGKGPEQYEFKYSAIGDGEGVDTVSKVAVLACMLIIGDKCVVETGTNGQTSDFEWRKYKTREECATWDEYYSQCFTLGFDPKIGDKLIGTEFDMQNNISYRLGIEAKGIAIPIKWDDKVSGAVKFMILGPVNTLWNEVTRRHRTWFRRTKWSEKSVPLLSHVSSIYIKSFEIKVYSDNGLINNTADNDLVYLSDTHETFINCKDDIDFKINSALTSAECRKLGVTDTVKLSTPLNLSSGYGLLSIYDHNKRKQAKPEQSYVDSYYHEYHKPRILMTQRLADTKGYVSRFNRYKHPAMPDKLFYVQGISYNVIENSAELTIKEVWND